ncbi:MAG: L,D-transpeptidase family protein [Rhizobiales bacterium]|nr:L,D-transpeptidase family protein [Hyphomicrobiales bacterium]
MFGSRTFGRFALALGLAAFSSGLSADTASAQNWFASAFGFSNGSGGGLFGSAPSRPSAGAFGTRSLVAFPSQYAPGQIIVSFADRRLYYIQAKGRAISYPIAVPREQSRWAGKMAITRKQENPTWTPTPEMRRENPRLPAVVAGGDPRNPLGYHALYLGSTLYRIHGTDAPWTIGQAVSKGCVRMHNQDVADLYRRVGVGTQVTVTWQRFHSI